MTIDSGVINQVSGTVIYRNSSPIESGDWIQSSINTLSLPTVPADGLYVQIHGEMIDLPFYESSVDLWESAAIYDFLQFEGNEE